MKLVKRKRVNILTNYDYVLSKIKVDKTPEQIIQEFRLFCQHQNGCIGCIFESHCTTFTLQQMDKWLTQEYNKSEWVDTDDLK